MNAFSLEGYGVGVTGGGGHLGRRMARGLADAGAIVVICGRSDTTLATAASPTPKANSRGRIIPVTADVSHPDDLERVLDRIESEADTVRGWVNNAFYTSTEQLGALSKDGLRRAAEGGFCDAALALDAAVRRMTPHRRGSIVNIATMYALVSPQPDTYREHPALHNPPGYGAAKAALLQFTRYAACHVASSGIRVNALSPGPFPSDDARKHEGFVDELARRVPLGRVGEADEIVGPLLFLLSDAASFVTGHNLVVDGGWTVW